MNYLARREHTELELKRKLRTKGFEAEAIQSVIAALVGEGLLSNRRFTEIYIHYRCERGYGPLRIQAELSDRGIPEDMIEHHLNITDNTWFAHARKTWLKRFKGNSPADFKSRAQQMRFLHQRGFTPEQINPIFQSDTEDA
jgi:regulatory protein